MKYCSICGRGPSIPIRKGKNGNDLLACHVHANEFIESNAQEMAETYQALIYWFWNNDRKALPKHIYQKITTGK